MICDNLSVSKEGHLLFAGQDTVELAKKYGTPVYLMDEDKIREKCRAYKNAFMKYFDDRAIPLYASKANSFKRIYEIMTEEGMGIDVVSSGEIYTALNAGFDLSKAYFHSNNKTDWDIAFAMDHGIGYFVADNVEEVKAVEAEAARRGITQKMLLRLSPGIDPHTFEEVATGKVDSKFGTAIETGQALEITEYTLKQPHIELKGFHCHVGSQVFTEDVFERAAVIMLEFIAECRDKLGFTADELDLGGGYGVRYVESDPRADIPARIGEVASHLKRILGEAGLPMPRILMEPGRSIVADAGMTVYTVCTVKHIPNCKNYVITDGGMADDPRWCLYRARYSVLHASRETGENEIFDLAGRCCESGDIVQPAVELPADTRRGDRVCVCTTGAYNYSMASNYNRLGRPPVVMLTGGSAWTAVRRETAEDLCALDL